MVCSIKKWGLINKIIAMPTRNNKNPIIAIMVLLALLTITVNMAIMIMNMVIINNVLLNCMENGRHTMFTYLRISKYLS